MFTFSVTSRGVIIPLFLAFYLENIKTGFPKNFFWGYISIHLLNVSATAASKRKKNVKIKLALNK